MNVGIGGSLRGISRSACNKQSRCLVSLLGATSTLPSLRIPRNLSHLRVEIQLSRPLGVSGRPFSTSFIRKAGKAEADTAARPDVLASYNAPLSKTFYRLKLFSLGSLTLASALCPALMLAPGSISMAGRIGLCCTALATSGASTALIAWIGKPYVAEMQLLTGAASKDEFERALPEESSETLQDLAMRGSDRPAIQVETRDWRLRRLQTTIYEPAFIRPTSRPFATWELPTMPPAMPLEEADLRQKQTVTKLVAATRNLKSGNITGRWWARWARDTLSKQQQQQGSSDTSAPSSWRADGQCREEGAMIRHFSIHEELLDEKWQVL